MKFQYLKQWKGWIIAMSLGFGFEANTVEVDGKGNCLIEQVNYPAVGFGTYPLQDKICAEALENAAKVGYRIMDTATFYENFIPIGKVLNKLGRHNFYVISKVWPNAQTAQRLREDLKRTLAQLQTSYLDAYLVHWPNSQIPIEETLRTMEELRRQRLIRHIGLSNVTVNHVKRALEVGVPITWVQVEMHPAFYDPELLEFCKKNSITIQAWAPLGRGRLSEDSFLSQLGEKYGKTASQIALRWIIQHGCIPLPNSKNKQHMLQNMDIMDFTLSREEMEAINQRAKVGKRERVTENFGLGFTDEFDFSYEECWPKQSNS